MKKIKAAWFESTTIPVFGGGERLEKILWETLGIKIYTFNKRLNVPWIEEVGTEVDRRVLGKPRIEKL